MDKRAGLKERFMEQLKTYFFSTSGEMDVRTRSGQVAAVNSINGWVEENTQGKIRDLLSPPMIDSLTKLVLVNAIYFKADWKFKFKVENTKKKDFFVFSDSYPVSVPMMHLTTNFEIAYLAQEDCKIIRLPYKGDRIVMDILLPNSRRGLDELEHQMINIQDSFDKNKRMKDVSLSLPKFKAESRIPLKNILKKLGMTDMFSGEANFTNIADDPFLYVSEVIQKAFIEVDERGTTAAAATAVLIRTRSFRRPTDFTVDHPFLFFLRFYSYS